MSRNIIGKYFWPSRFGDIARWCASCDACQRLGPVRLLSTLSPITQLQPMDMIGMDFIGPFNPVTNGDGKYVIIAVNYFSRYLWARVAASNHGYIVESFLKKAIVQNFSWPLAVYVDNGSHFVKGILPKLLAQQGVKLFSAPVTHPRSVGLSERYVQMILAGLRSKVISDPRTGSEKQWGEHLPEVVHAINTRLLRVHGYTPSQLFMGFNAKMDAYEEGVMDDAMRQSLEQHLGAGFPIDNLEKQQCDVRMAKMEEMRELSRERFTRYQDEQALAYAKNRYAAPEEGDLVLLRRFVVDKERGRKLEPRWEGPYLLKRIAKAGISGYLMDIKTLKIKGRYGFDALKVYVPREEQVPRTDMSCVDLDQGMGMLCEGWYRGRRVDVTEWKERQQEEGSGYVKERAMKGACLFG